MTMPRPKSKTLAFLYDRHVGDDPELIAEYEKSRAASEVASSVYKLRIEAGLSQRALAARVGTSASVICQLEDADYEGHSLSMLRRIAAAVGRRVEVSFPLATEPAAAKRVPRIPGQIGRRPPVAASPPDMLDVAEAGKPPKRAAAKKRS
jgi:transcriptional regulator with XRE-family HTH domain